jgi:hypothetical protein
MAEDVDEFPFDRIDALPPRLADVRVEDRGARRVLEEP